MSSYIFYILLHLFYFLTSFYIFLYSFYIFLLLLTSFCIFLYSFLFYPPDTFISTYRREKQNRFFAFILHFSYNSFVCNKIIYDLNITSIFQAIPFSYLVFLHLELYFFPNPLLVYNMETYRAIHLHSR